MDVQSHIFLTLALVGDKWSASRPSCFNPGERYPCTHWIGGWVSLRAGFDEMKKNFLTLLGHFNSEPSVLLSVASCYTDCTTSTNNLKTYYNMQETGNSGDVHTSEKPPEHTAE
jgi:hypothetical protein